MLSPLRWFTKLFNEVWFYTTLNCWYHNHLWMPMEIKLSNSELCLFIKFETAKCFTTFLCRDHISVMLEFHTQMTAHNRVHYCTFLIVSLITPLDIDRWHGLMIFFLLLRKIDSKFCFCGLWRCLLSLFVLLLTTIAACLVDKLLRHCCSVISFLTFFSFFLSSDTVFFFVSSLEHFSSCLI